MEQAAPLCLIPSAEFVLATGTAALSAIRDKLTRNRATSPAFNTAVFTRALEDAYTQMVARARAGLAPDHIFVK